MNTNDTIVAPATAPGDGGIAIIRISGSSAYTALRAYFNPTANLSCFESHRLYHGNIHDGLGHLVDEVMAVYMAAPRTYTRDDVVEIHCHGSQQIVSAILHLYTSYGLRLAEPGEFTYRAFINGRLDLSQAEAVAKLIGAKSNSAYRLALSQVGGLLSRQIRAFTQQLKSALVLSEVWIDFPEENIPREDTDKLSTVISQVLAEIHPLLDTYNQGRVLSEGAAILLLGQPNVGKSSLLNSLLGEERAIVTAVPGTTRDILEEGLVIGGVPVRLIDTAGIHDSVDLVEREGIRRAEKKLEGADLVLLLIDGHTDINEYDIYIQNQCAGLPTFVVLTKEDLGCRVQVDSFPKFPTFLISSKTGHGIDDLRTAIAAFLVGDYLPTSESVMLTEKRHYEALLVCKKCLFRARELVSMSESLEFLSFELREALQALGQISGETTTEEILDDVFSGFCIGK